MQETQYATPSQPTRDTETVAFPAPFVRPSSPILPSRKTFDGQAEFWKRRYAALFSPDDE